MDRDLLYQMLDIESPSDFQYFENLSDLLECDEHIEYDDLYFIFKDVNKENLSQLVHDYFEELSDFIPGDAAELFVLLEKIKLSLMGMLKSADEENILATFTEEINRFRIWYSTDSSVICTSLDGNGEEDVPLRDALALSRLEGLDGDKYSYDFSKCLDYSLDEYIMSFGDIISAAE